MTKSTYSIIQVDDSGPFIVGDDVDVVTIDASADKDNIGVITRMAVLPDGRIIKVFTDGISLFYNIGTVQKTPSKQSERI